MRLYRDPKVKFGGMEVGGIRISHASHIDGPKTFPLTATRGRKAPYTVKPLEAQEVEAPQNTKQPERSPQAVYEAMNKAIHSAETFKRHQEILKGKRWIGDLAFLKENDSELFSLINSDAEKVRQKVDPAMQAPAEEEEY